jgi:hypothetical protein
MPEAVNPEPHPSQFEQGTTSSRALLDVQAGLLNNLATRVVVPLITASSMGKPGFTCLASHM